MNAFQEGEEREREREREREARKRSSADVLCDINVVGMKFDRNIASVWETMAPSSSRARLPRALRHRHVDENAVRAPFTAFRRLCPRLSICAPIRDRGARI